MHLRSSFLLLPLFVAMAFVFSACPVSTKFPLGEKTALKIDKRLIGTWGNDSASVEVTKVSIARHDENTYDVEVLEKGSMYMSENTRLRGWLSAVDTKTFLVLQELENGAETNIYYVYCLSDIQKNELTTNDITLKVGGTDAVTSTQAYRDEVAASMKMDDFLAGTIVWKRK